MYIFLRAWNPPKIFFRLFFRLINLEKNTEWELKGFFCGWRKKEKSFVRFWIEWGEVRDNKTVFLPRGCLKEKKRERLKKITKKHDLKLRLVFRFDVSDPYISSYQFKGTSGKNNSYLIWILSKILFFVCDIRINVTLGIKIDV